MLVNLIGAKKYVVNHFLKKNKQFVYLRRYKTELKQAMFKGKDPIFFDQIQNEFPNLEMSNTKDSFKINGKTCGFAMPLSVANILKSGTYENVDTIIFDEFLLSNGVYHYLQNEVIQFLDVIETIARTRKIKVFIIGNAISVTNPYFDFFGLTLPYNSEFKTFKDGLIVVNYIKNMEYREMKKSTDFGKLITGTEYGKYAIDNEFLEDNKSFIRKKTSDAKFNFTLNINGNYYGVWTDYNIGYMFISKSYQPNFKIIFTINPNDHNEKTLLIRTKSSPFYSAIISYYRMSRLCFDSQHIKNNCMNSLLKYLY